MKTVFYIVRHGKTLFNELRRFQGISDSPLTEEAIEMANRLHDGLLDVDFVLGAASTSERAIDTLECIVQDRNIPMIHKKALKEMSFGRLEGSLIDFSTPPSEIESVGYKWCGGENRDEAGERFMACLKEIAVEGNVLVTSHCGVILYMIMKLRPDIQFMDANELAPNCSVMKVLLENGKFSILEMPTMKYNKI